MSRHHRVDCPKSASARAKLKKKREEDDDDDDFGGCSDEEEEGAAARKYVPVKLDGICPFCELKFADLLGHIR